MAEDETSNPDESMMMLNGVEITIQGTVHTHTDLNGIDFMTVELYTT